MEKIIFATSNSGKMREIREIMQDLGVEILSMKEAGIEADIVEDGKTFEEISSGEDRPRYYEFTRRDIWVRIHPMI